MAKAKWLVEATNSELVAEVQAGLTNTEDTKVVNRAMKAADELLERTPQESDSPSVEEVITNMKADFLASTDKLQKAYQSELEAIDPDAPEDMEVEEDDEVPTEAPEDDLDGKTLKELRAIAKDLGIVTKGLKKPDLIEEINSLSEVAEYEEDSEEDEVVLEDLTLKELKALAKEEGIKVKKGMKKPELIEALSEVEEDDSEDEDEEDDEVVEEVEVEDYNELSIKDLKAAARERGIRVTKGIKKTALIEALEADDEEA